MVTGVGALPHAPVCHVPCKPVVLMSGNSKRQWMLDLERTRTVKGAEPSGVQIRRRRSDRRRHLSAFSVVGTSNLILIQPNECARSWTGSGTAGDTAQAATRQHASTTSTRKASRGNRLSRNAAISTREASTRYRISTERHTMVGPGGAALAGVYMCHLAGRSVPPVKLDCRAELPVQGRNNQPGRPSSPPDDGDAIRLQC